MSSAPAISVSAPSANNTLSAVSTTSLGVSGGIPGLFLNLLSMNSLMANTTETNLALNTTTQTPTSTTQFGKSGFSFEPTLLVLPQGIANLSESDLQALLANASVAADGTFGNQVLISLTPGTPAAQAIADFLSKLGQDASVTTLPVTTQTATDSALTTTDQTATTQGNILLVATNLSPSDMEQLKSILSEQGNADSAASIAKNLDGTDATDTTAVALMMFVPPPLQNQIAPAPTGDGSNIMTIGSDISTPTTPVKINLGKYISPFAAANGESDELSDGMTSLFTQADPTDFKGSLSSQSDTAADANSNINGKLDAQANLATTSSLESWKLPSTLLSDTTSLLTSNGSMPTGQSPLANPLINNPSAASSHPATQMVAVMIEKSISGSEKSQQTLSVQLDPPELGRVQVQLSYEKGEPMKVHLLAENKDTLSILQRDSHTLKAALEQAGIQTDGSSLTFDMAGGDQSFNQMLGQFQDGNNSRNQNTSFSLSGDIGNSSDSMLQTIETRMDFTPDSLTGNIHYSLLV